MDIGNDKSNIPKHLPLNDVKPKQKLDAEKTSPSEKKSKSPKFISEDVKNYFSYNLKTNFDRAATSKNSVTYDLDGTDYKPSLL
jgi:hypothetical protein